MKSVNVSINLSKLESFKSNQDLFRELKRFQEYIDDFLVF